MDRIGEGSSKDFSQPEVIYNDASESSLTRA